MSQDQFIENAQKQRRQFLEAIYELSSANPIHPVNLEDVAPRMDGMTLHQVWPIAKYLHDKGLIKIFGHEEWIITADGIDAIENPSPSTQSVIGPTTIHYHTIHAPNFRQGAIQQGSDNSTQTVNNAVDDQRDRELILFYSQALDRQAFRTYFHQEQSYSNFDRAMEDTLIAINTGYVRINGTIIEQSKGKVYLVRSDWRRNMDEVGIIIEGIRREFQRVLGLDKMLMNYHHGRKPYDYKSEQKFDRHFRFNEKLATMIDKERNRAIKIMNSMLSEIDQVPLTGI